MIRYRMISIRRSPRPPPSKWRVAMASCHGASNSHIFPHHVENPPSQLAKRWGGDAMNGCLAWLIFTTNIVFDCSATATISYPASLSKLPNGCQGHPRFCPSPPDRSPITKPDSNCVLRAATFIQLLAWVDIKMHKAVEA